MIRGHLGHELTLCSGRKRPGSILIRFHTALAGATPQESGPEFNDYLVSGCKCCVVFQGRVRWGVFQEALQTARAAKNNCDLRFVVAPHMRSVPGVLAGTYEQEGVTRPGSRSNSKMRSGRASASASTTDV